MQLLSCGDYGLQELVENSLEASIHKPISMLQAHRSGANGLTIRALSRAQSASRSMDLRPSPSSLLKAGGSRACAFR